MQKSDLLRLIESIRAALCAGGMSEDIAGPFAELAKNLASLLPDEFARPRPKDAGLVGLVDTIDHEWKRSSTNLRALLLTTLRDKPEDVARAKIEKLLELHLRFEIVMLQSLLDVPHSGIIIPESSKCEA